MKKMINKVIALIIAIIMVVGMVPASAITTTADVSQPLTADYSAIEDGNVRIYVGIDADWASEWAEPYVSYYSADGLLQFAKASACIKQISGYQVSPDSYKNINVYYADIPQNSTNILFSSSDDESHIVKGESFANYTAEMGNFYYLYSYRVDDNYMGCANAAKFSNISVTPQGGSNKYKLAYSLENQSPVCELRDQNIQYFYQNSVDESFRISITDGVWDTTSVPGGLYNVYAVATDDNGVYIKSGLAPVNIDYKASKPKLELAESTSADGKYYICGNYGDDINKVSFGTQIKLSVNNPFDGVGVPVGTQFKYIFSKKGPNDYDFSSIQESDSNSLIFSPLESGKYSFNVSVEASDSSGKTLGISQLSDDKYVDVFGSPKFVIAPEDTSFTNSKEYNISTEVNDGCATGFIQYQINNGTIEDLKDNKLVIDYGQVISNEVSVTLYDYDKKDGILLNAINKKFTPKESNVSIFYYLDGEKELPKELYINKPFTIKAVENNLKNSHFTKNGEELDLKTPLLITLDEFNKEPIELNASGTKADDSPVESKKYTVVADDIHPSVSMKFEDASGEEIEAKNAIVKSGTTAIITVKEKNFDKDLAAKAINITVKDVDGNDLDKNSYSIDDWVLQDNGDYIKKIKFKSDGNYAIKVAEFFDKCGNNSNTIDTTNFTIDSNGPEIKVEYSESLSTRFFLLDTNFERFNFYNDTVKVKITATDNISGVSKIKCTINDTATLKGRDEQVEYSAESKNNTEVFTINIEPQFIGKLLVEAYDFAEKSSAYDGDRTVVVDNISPEMSITYTSKDDGVCATNGDSVYYNKGVVATLVVEEANFFEGNKESIGDNSEKNINNIIITASYKDDMEQTHTIRYVPNGNDIVEDAERNSVKGIKWEKNNNIYQTTFTCDQDGDYEFSVEYEDNSQRKAKFDGSDVATGKYKKSGIVVDTTLPKVEVSYDKEPVNAKYFRDSVIATFKVTEHNFNETLAKDGIKIRDINGDIIEDMSNVKLSEWTNNGDVHTMTAEFKNGTYAMNVSFKDKATNDSTFSSTLDGGDTQKFIVDDGNPDEIDVVFETSVVDRIIQGITFGFYKPVYKGTIKAKDDLSGISKIEYYFKSEDGEYVRSDSKVFDTPFVSSEANLVVDNLSDFRGTFVATAYNMVGRSKATDTNNNKYVFDQISPQISIKYSGENPIDDTSNQIMYYPKGVKVELQVKEQNFFEGQKDENTDSYINNILITANRVDDNGKIHTINFVPYEVDTLEGDDNVSYQTISWDNYDDNTHSSSFTCNADGDYSFSVKYKDNSDNMAEFNGLTEDLGVYTKSGIVVDQTAPNITVEYDNNSPINDNYYHYRTATVKVEEHNFSDDIATDALSIVSKDVIGNEVDGRFNISSWVASENGNVHTATINFLDGANFDFGMIYKDIAGNPGNIVNEKFTVDDTAPNPVEITYSESIVSKILNAVTFGFYKNEAIVTVTADDAISGLDYIDYKYSVDDGVSSKNVGGSGRIAGNDIKRISGTNSQYATFTIPAQFRGKVSAVAYDMTNNCGVNEDDTTIVVDNIEPGIDVIYTAGSATDGKTTYYNEAHPLTATIKINEANFLEGQGMSNGELDIINDVKILVYCVDNNGVQTIVNYVPEALADGIVNKKISWNAMGEDEYQATLDFSIDGDYTIEISYSDSSENSSKKYLKTGLTVDNTNPEIYISYDKNDNVEGGKYFSAAQRTATLTVDEHNFDKNSATNGIKIKATDANGNAVTNTYFLSSWVDNGDKHTMTIKYFADANYSFDISFDDCAKNYNNSVAYASGTVAQNNFCLDVTNPTANISIGEWGGAFWNKFINVITFNLWSSQSQQVNITAKDNLSEVNNIYYFVSDKIMNIEEVRSLTTQWIDTKSTNRAAFSIYPNSISVVYSKIVDNAGNVFYLSSDGVILDNNEPVIDGVAPQTEIKLNNSSDVPLQDANGNDIYNGNIVLDINIYDPIISGRGTTSKGVSSGLNLDKLTYQVINSGAVTQSGNLPITATEQDNYTKLLLKAYSTITIDSALNNSNDVQLQVFASDNAGNTSTEIGSYMIDITNPSIQVDYDNNSQDNKFERIFKNSRTATVSITERNFNSDRVKFDITSDSGSQPGVSGWVKSNGGSGNGDDTVYQATINFTEDSDYTFNIAYTDEAGNNASSVNYGNAVAPTAFTIDQTKPEISVAYDNNSFKNTNYYKSSRKATIGIKEHNFETTRVAITGTAVDGDTKIKFPAISQWTSSGDMHYATINFDTDALYTLDINYTDMAGNVAASYGTDKFYIDKTAPELTITGVNYKSANKDDTVGFELKGNDANFDTMTPKLTVSKIDAKGNIIIEDIGLEKSDTTGKLYKVENLDADGVYSIMCTVVDKAGNSTTKIRSKDNNDKSIDEECMLFSVNRKGSTFILGTLEQEKKGEISFEKELKEKRYVQNIENNITITEINPDVIIEKDVTLQNGIDNKNTLNEDADYSLVKSESENSWKEYRYTVDKKLFTNEDNYVLTLDSMDKASNTSFSINTDAKLSFTVDRTAPNLDKIVGLDSNKTYNVENQEVKLSISDKLSPLSSVIIMLNNEEYESYTAQELNERDGEITLLLKSANASQNLEIIAIDAANNSTSSRNENGLVYENFLITTDAFTLFLHNTLALCSTIGGILLVILLVIFLIVRKKKSSHNH